MSKNYYVEASGFFLTRPYPKDWDDRSDWDKKKWADLYKFIDAHITEHYEHWDSYLIDVEIRKLNNLLSEVVNKEVSDE